MPRNGALNPSFGVYRNVCCGLEIVIPEGVAFPDCPQHPRLPTEWKPLHDEPFPHASELPDSKKMDPAA